ncbi:MAG: hypothetical protein V4516_10245, partial [Pseudomonadota bacterium]
MTYRLCVIGNSHVAAFKLGWDQLAARGDALTRAIAPTFFGAPRDGLKNLAVRDGRLVPTADFVRDHFARMSGGRADVDPAVYDGFLLVGLGASMKRALRFYRTHRWFGLQQHPGRPVTSRSFARAFLAAAMAGDGAQKPGSFDFYQKERDEREWFQTLLHLCGMAGRVEDRKSVVYGRRSATTMMS